MAKATYKKKAFDLRLIVPVHDDHREEQGSRQVDMALEPCLFQKHKVKRVNCYGLLKSQGLSLVAYLLQQGHTA